MREPSATGAGPGWLLRTANLRAGPRLMVGALGGALAAMLVPSGIGAEVRAIATWDGFAAVSLFLTWLAILTLKPLDICSLAKREDPGRVVAMVIVMVGAVASLLAVTVLLQESMSMQSLEKFRAITLALSAVALAWLLIHTIFTLRYAHLYYDAPEGSNPLEFPGDDELPDYMDFAYFAFVVGMTAQTSDVVIRRRNIRRTVLLHGTVSFAFNTAVVALSIGVLTTLLASP